MKYSQVEESGYKFKIIPENSVTFSDKEGPICVSFNRETDAVRYRHNDEYVVYEPTQEFWVAVVEMFELSYQYIIMQDEVDNNTFSDLLNVQITQFDMPTIPKYEENIIKILLTEMVDYRNKDDSKMYIEDLCIEAYKQTEYKTAPELEQ